VFRCLAGTCGGGSRCREDQKNRKYGAKQGESYLSGLTKRLTAHERTARERRRQGVRLSERLGITVSKQAG
jgi:hypothetical protein